MERNLGNVALHNNGRRALGRAVGWIGVVGGAGFRIVKDLIPSGRRALLSVPCECDILGLSCGAKGFFVIRDGCCLGGPRRRQRGGSRLKGIYRLGNGRGVGLGLDNDHVRGEFF